MVMLHAIAFEDRDSAVVAADWTGHRDRPRRKQQAVALIHWNIKIISDHLELACCHLKHRASVNGHRSLHAFPLPASRNRAGIAQQERRKLLCLNSDFAAIER
jgi:hypothetical protein